jgi:putative phage-type endonuclease
MENALETWILDNRPYTHLHTRIKHFVLFCRTLQPELSYTKLRRIVVNHVDRILNEEGGRRWMRDRCFERVLRLYGQNDQRTDAWHTKRGEMITASEVYKIFGTEDARREILLRKLEPPVSSSASPPIPALLWGTRFEPVAKKLYEERTNCKILDVSCVQHPVHSFLGASPDGLIIPNEVNEARYGRLVEFKCPMSRVEKPEIPIAYIHQMQMQMECTGIDECEYVEFRFKQVNFNEWSKATGTKGKFGVYEDGRVDYEIEDCPDDCQIVYWILNSIKEDFVKKDPNWLSSHLPQLQSFWDEVVRHRTAGTKPTTPGLPTLDL